MLRNHMSEKLETSKTKDLGTVKLEVWISAVVCAVTAAPSRPIVVPDLVHSAPAAVVSAPVAVVSSQSHAQDELGQYSYSYSNPLSAKVETKTVDGVTRGGYSYLDSHGLVQNVNYVSDDVNGFRVAASNLPLGQVTPQQDEPIVAHEKAKALAALHQASVHEQSPVTVVHANDVASEPVYVEPSLASAPAAPPTAYLAEVHSTPAPPVVVNVTPAPALVAPAASPVSPVVHVTPAPAPVAPVVSAVPYLVEAHSTPAPPLEVHVTPAPFRPIPTALPVPVEQAHSYATVELDSSDIPAPSPSPGAYFHARQAPVALSPNLIPISTPAPTVHDVPASPEINVVAPVPTAGPVPPVGPVVHSAPAAVVSAPVAVVSSQSHAQDELGQYSYSYSNPLSAKVETKTVDGVTRGGYSYLDSHGLVQNVNYVSDDHNGFRVAASNLPSAAVPVDIPDSDDVAAAKAVFFAEIAKAKAAAGQAH